MTLHAHQCQMEPGFQPVSGFCDHCEAPALRFYCEECDYSCGEGFLELPDPPATKACRICGYEFFRPSRLPQVLNMRIPEHRQRVARGEAKRADRRTKWGNPFITGRDGTRDEVIAKHKAWLAANFTEEDLAGLRGWDLACWCAPKTCHCDELLRRANRLVAA